MRASILDSLPPPGEARMNKHLIAIAAAAFLAGCGGGSDESASTSTSTPAAAAAQLRTIEAMRRHGAVVHYGRWLIDGYPKV